MAWKKLFIVLLLLQACSESKSDNRDENTNGKYYESSVLPAVNASLAFPLTITGENNSSLMLVNTDEGYVFDLLKNLSSTTSAMIASVLVTGLVFDLAFTNIDSYCSKVDPNWLTCSVPSETIEYVVNESIRQEVYYRMGGKERLASSTIKEIESLPDSGTQFLGLDLERSSTTKPFGMTVKVKANSISNVKLEWDSDYTTLKMGNYLGEDETIPLASQTIGFNELSLSEKGIFSRAKVSMGTATAESSLSLMPDSSFSDLGGNGFSVSGSYKASALYGSFETKFDAFATDEGGSLDGTSIQSQVSVDTLTLSEAADEGKIYALVDLATESKELVVTSLFGYLAGNGTTNPTEFAVFDSNRESAILWELTTDQDGNISGAAENASGITADLELTKDQLYTRYRETWNSAGAITGVCQYFEDENCVTVEGEMVEAYDNATETSSAGPVVTLSGLTEDELHQSVVLISESGVDLTSYELWSDEFESKLIGNIVYFGNGDSNLKDSGLPNYEFFIYDPGTEFESARYFEVIYLDGSASLVELTNVKASVDY